MSFVYFLLQETQDLEVIVKYVQGNHDESESLKYSAAKEGPTHLRKKCISRMPRELYKTMVYEMYFLPSLFICLSFSACDKNPFLVSGVIKS